MHQAFLQVLWVKILQRSTAKRVVGSFPMVSMVVRESKERILASRLEAITTILEVITLRLESIAIKIPKMLSFSKNQMNSASASQGSFPPPSGGGRFLEEA